MKKRILFVAQKMSVGGIGSSLINLLKVIREEKKDEYEVELFTFAKGKLLEKIPEGISVTYGNRLLSLASSSFSDVIKSCNVINIVLRMVLMVYARVRGSDKLYRNLLKKHCTLKEYDVAISYFNDITTGYFSRGTNMYVSCFTKAEKKIAWIHTDPFLCKFDARYCEKIYGSFDRILCVSKAVKEKMDLLVPSLNKKTEVFYNIFCEKEINEKSNEYVPFKNDLFNIVTVGRIDNDTKRVDGIIKICKRLKDDGVFGYMWHIVGNGPDLNKNIKLAKKLDVLDMINFVGEQINPYPYIKYSDLFALYSAYEGYPMVIGETQIIGTRIITTNYAAAQEQINKNQDIICDDDEDFYKKIKKLILKRKTPQEERKNDGNIVKYNCAGI